MNKTWIIFKNTLIDNYNLNKTFLNKDKDPKIVLKKVFTVLGAAFLLIYLMFIMGTYTYMGINYVKTFGINMNLWSGLGMLVFGGLMLLFAKRNKKKK